MNRSPHILHFAFALAAATAAPAPASAPAWGAEQGSCTTGLFTLRGDYAGARLGPCQMIGLRELEIRMEPEDAPINPSPWYGFHARATKPDAGTLSISLNYGAYAHRYRPKASADGVVWQPLPASDVTVSDDGGAIIRVQPGQSGLYVSAQENIGNDRYEAWLNKLATDHPDARLIELGSSIEGHPIRALQVNPEAPRHLLLLGRQHPPEVTGALALMAFAERLLAKRIEACAHAQPTCAFFERHGFMVAPNLNPDGVARGHWRHNLGGVDLNRNWGAFTQPETQAVRDWVDALDAPGQRLALILDFHSTNRNVFYVQDARSPTDPPEFAWRWLTRATAAGNPAPFEYAPRPLTGLGTAKNYFHGRFGVPSITYELADEEDRGAIAASAAITADALVATLATPEAHPPLTAQCGDFFCHLVDANMASLAMLTEEGLIDAALAGRIASGMSQILHEQALPNAPRWRNYKPFEARLVELAGVEATNLHLGRSRQDLHGVTRRMQVRDRWLAAFGALLSARQALLDLAEREANTPVPAYTHGVQAQPTTFGHYLLAFGAALNRDAGRLRQGYARLNRSPFGAAALSTSGFPLNRHRLATLLGFDGPVENSYDANLLSSADYKMELANALALSAIATGQFVENLHTQYHDPNPWIILNPDTTSASTIMPQKRNPLPLNRLRSLASQVVGDAQTVLLLAHNTNTGMHDYRQAEPVLALTDRASELYAGYASLIDSLQIDRQRALAELGQGYSTMTEVADTLAREAGVPFRTAHAYASALTEHCRTQGIKTAELSGSEIARIFAETTGRELPVEPRIVHEALDPVAMIHNRQGFGGPQPDELQRSLARHRNALGDHQDWLEQAEGQLRAARFELHSSFLALVSSADD